MSDTQALPPLLPPLPKPTVRCGDYAGPPGEGASENLWDSDALEAYAIAHAAALQAENDQQRERLEFLSAACRDAQEHATVYGSKLLEQQAENDKLRATLRALVDHHDLMSREDYAEIRAARASITGSQG